MITILSCVLSISHFGLWHVTDPPLPPRNKGLGRQCYLPISVKKINDLNYLKANPFKGKKALFT